MKEQMKRIFCFKTVIVLALAVAIFIGAAMVYADPWKFGVMSDTQWPNSPDLKNPNVSVNVIRHLNQEFINHGVKFVIQVGDLTDTGGTNNINLDVRATFAQDLYNAGIGFYPLRGNHENTQSNAVRFQQIFPQTQTGLNNQTPNMVSTTIYGDLTDLSKHPDYNPNTFSVCGNFASEPSMEGLTYSFDCGNARFVLIDQFTKPSGSSHSNLTQTDVDWIGGRLSDPNRPDHSFVFAHKHLISENHNDNLFNSSNPTASQASKDLMESYMQYLNTYGVRYHIGGHDHMHNRAIVSSPNTGNYKVQNIIAASDSYKFYIPPGMATFNTQTWRSLEQQIAQEIFTVGYYIFTVDGPKVTVDYYAMPNGCNGDCDQTYDVIPYEGNTPTAYPHVNPTVFFSDTVPFTKHETFGYSLNGKEILVPQDGSYALTDDTSKAVLNGETDYIGTTAAILGGTNGSKGMDFNGRKLTKTVDTGWAPATAGLASDIFTLLGMADSLATNFTDLANLNYHYQYVVPNTTLTDTYVLSMSFGKNTPREYVGNGGFGIATRDADGNWVKAVDMNVGGTKQFVNGPWNSSYGLGAYGVDTSTNTAWAVINHASDFAVAGDLGEELTALNPANVWIGVTNSDNNGRKIDIKVEVSKNGVLIGRGEMKGVKVAGNALNNSTRFTIPLSLTDGGVTFKDGDSLQCAVFVRGAGSGNFGVKLWYNNGAKAKNRGWSNYGAVIDGNALDYFFRAGSMLSDAAGAIGLSNAVNLTTSYKSLGSWSVELP